MAYVFAHGWNWEIISTATITHSIIKLMCELATLHFCNLSKESTSDWAVIVTRIGARHDSPFASSTSAAMTVTRLISKLWRRCTPSLSLASPPRRFAASLTWVPLRSSPCLFVSA